MAADGDPDAEQEQRRAEQNGDRDGRRRSQTVKHRGSLGRMALAQAPTPRADWPASLQGPSPAYQTPA